MLYGQCYIYCKHNNFLTNEHSGNSCSKMFPVYCLLILFLIHVQMTGFDTLVLHSDILIATMKFQ